MPLAPIVAIVVTFNPEPDRLTAMLGRLRTQVTSTVVVDNGSRASPDALVARSDAAVTLIELGNNYGIAYAQNRGIDFARQQGAAAVLLMDQDSLPDSGMVAELSQVYENLSARGIATAAIGPSYRDEGLQKKAPALNRDMAVPGIAADEVDHVIASGSLLTLAAIDRVGPMRDDLFIDYVDIEWALRARTFGLRSFMARNATMSHQFGTPLTIFGRQFSSHTPMRQYYLFRNSIWLWRQNWVPLGWKLRRGRKLLLRLLFSMVFARPLLEQWRLMWRGIAHGISGKMGRGHD